MSGSKISELTQQRCDTTNVDGQQFRDLDHDGILAPYEDWLLPAAERAADLVSRMTLAEKVGALLHGHQPGKPRPFRDQRQARPHLRRV